MDDDRILVHDETPPSPCRRCTVCDGLTHHWLEDPEQSASPQYDYVCKHCSVAGRSCTTCDGDEDADEDCPMCHGEGVIRIEGLQVMDPDGENEEVEP